jgi:hypothetical protein
MKSDTDGYDVVIRAAACPQKKNVDGEEQGEGDSGAGASFKVGGK